MELKTPACTVTGPIFDIPQSAQSELVLDQIVDISKALMSHHQNLDALTLAMLFARMAAYLVANPNDDAEKQIVGRRTVICHFESVFVNLERAGELSKPH